ELVFREISNGATSDLEKVNRIARAMVKQFGMSRLGRIYCQGSGSAAFLNGAGEDGWRDYSEETSREIDREVRQIIEQATEDVRELLRARRPALEAIAARLMEKEVMDARELRELLAQHPAGEKVAS